MATTEQVRDAVERLSAMFDGVDDATRRKIPDESVSVYVKDLDQAYGCRFENGDVVDVREIDAAEIKSRTVRISCTSDVLLDVVDGRLHFGHGWATGKIRVDAKLRDILKLRGFLTS
jgi:hypothetical protein